jgi:UDP-N-acetylglucosamine--N-acetylmuramyl-(pentapeptide) pyrophosphoryl-undecaprenol N-acetylglucosamine transferase
LQGKACIIVPSPFLTGGHQLKNAQVLADKTAAVVVDELDVQSDPNRLAKLINDLLSDDQLRDMLAHNMARLAEPEATTKLATLLLAQAKKQ